MFRGFPRRKVLGYCIAQVFGGFIAAAIVYSCFQSSWTQFDNGTRVAVGLKGTGGIFYVQPREGVSLGNHFFSEMMGTMILMIIICAVIDRHNNSDSDIVLPIVLGFTVTAVLVSLGMWCQHIFFVVVLLIMYTFRL
jgi:aquaglyceroporin related protein